MVKSKTYSNKGFKYCIIGISLIFILVLVLLITSPNVSDFESLLIGFLVFTLGIISIIGLLASIKGLKEPNTVKKIIGLIFNFGIVLLFLAVIIGNIYDIYTAVF